MILKGAKIEEFRDRFDIEAVLNSQVCYIIGRNGTGKTTFVRYLVAAMQCDIRYLSGVPFRSIEIEFFDVSEPSKPCVLKYFRPRDPQISSPLDQSFNVSLEIPDKQKMETNSTFLSARGGVEGEYMLVQDMLPIFYDEAVSRMRAIETHKRSSRSQENIRRAANDARKIKQFLGTFAEVRWLPIERISRTDEDGETRRRSQDSMSPVNRKVTEIQNALVRYFSELDKRKAEELELFRNHALLALFNVESSRGRKAGVGKARISALRAELEQLLPELQLSDDLAAKFRANSDHLMHWLDERRGRPAEALRQALARLEEVLGYWQDTQKKMRQIFEKRNVFFAALSDAFSLNDVEESHRRKFAKLPVLKDNNEIGFVSNSKEESPIRLLDLSSGEKQFFIMLAEALLERGSRTLLFIDEPEISLHINWQSRLVKDLITLNPNVQLILATHSPDVVATNHSAVVRMEEAVSLSHA